MYADVDARRNGSGTEEYLATARQRSRRSILLAWLRKTHLYTGLWGAVLGLLFGVTGIVLNHRTVMKIPVERLVQRTVQLPLPAQVFESPEQMAVWLQKEIALTPSAPPIIRSHPAKTVIWGDREVQQPERWTISLARPERGVIGEYIVGNRFIKLEHLDATPIGTLARLHMASGAGVLWILLSDTIAGSLILLSLTGLLLWTQLHTIRTVAVLTGISALLASMWIFWAA